jgi:hypothetical protein
LNFNLVEVSYFSLKLARSKTTARTAAKANQTARSKTKKATEPVETPTPKKSSEKPEVSVFN